MGEVGDFGPAGFIRDGGVAILAVDDDVVRAFPVRHEVQVEGLHAGGGDDFGEFVEFVAEGEVAETFGHDGAGGAAEGVEGAGWQEGHQAGEGAPGGLGEPGELIPELAADVVAFVAAEEFVAGVATEGDGDVLAGHFADEVGGDLRVVGEGFVVEGGELRDDVEGVLAGDVHFGVVGAEVLGDVFGELGFVVFFFVEADGEGADGAGALRLHEGDDEGGIDAAGEEGAEGDIGDHALADGVFEQGFEGVDGFGFGADEGVLSAVGDDVAEGPVVARGGAVGGGAEGEEGGGGELVQALVNAPGIGDVVEAEEGGEGGAVDGGGEAGEAIEAFQFGAEDEGVADPAIVEGFFAEAVAAEVQDALLFVPEGEGEHAVEALGGGVDAPLDEGGEHDLGVGVAAPSVAVFFEFGAEVLEVVDLAIEDDFVAAVGAGHGLVAEGGEIEDGEAAVAEGDAGFGIGPGAFVIGAAGDDGVGHAADGGGEGFVGSALGGGEEADDTAHRCKGEV